MSAQRYIVAANVMASSHGISTLLLGGHPTRLLTVKGAEFIQQAIGSPCRRFFASWARTASPRITAPTSSSLAPLLVDKGLLHPFPATYPLKQVASNVTVVIPVKDSEISLHRLLQSLQPYLDEGTRVIVVDDGSDRPVDTQLGAGIRVVRFEQNQGPAAARNCGFRLAGTPYVAFIDTDCWVNPGWMEKLCGHFHDPKVVMVAPRIVGDHAAGFTSAIEEFECARSSLDMGNEPALVAPHTPVSYVPSAALAVHKERVCSQLGDNTLFDESLRCGEDVDLCWRLADTDGVIRYEPAATVGHDHRIDPARWAGRKFFYGTSAAPLACTHGRKVAPVVMTPLMMVIAIGLWSGRRPAVTVAVGALLYSQYSLVRKIPVPVLAAAVNSSIVWASIDQAAAAMWRAYWPVSAFSVVLVPATRMPLVAMALYDAARDWRVRGIHTSTHTHILNMRSAATHLVLHRIEAITYSAGVYAGFVRSLKNGRGWQSKFAILPYLSR